MIPILLYTNFGKRQEREYIYETKGTISDLAIKESGMKTISQNTVIKSFKLSTGKTGYSSFNLSRT